MHERKFPLSKIALACLLSLSWPSFAYSEAGSSATSDQSTTIAEERTDIAKEEADIARESLALEERKAALAERKASLTRRETRSSKKTVTRTTQLEQELAELRARETERGLVLTLGDVLFETGQAKLTADAMRKLYPLVTLLKESPRRSIFIEGHTDSSGSESYNLNLSQQRAEVVRDFLISTGITPERITARGYGEESPVASNTNETGRRENRRVEVIVMREGDRVATKAR